jgi:hypothetical protein
MDHLTIAKLLDTHRTRIVDQTVALAQQNPFWEDRFGPGITERLALDFDLNLANLAKGIRYRSPMIFDDHALWRRNQILSFGCSTGHFREMFGYKWAAINQMMPSETLPTIYDYMQSGMAAVMPRSANLQQVIAAQDELAEMVVAATFDESWHWQAAYAQEGREKAVRDAWFLFDYAVDSLEGGKLEVLGRHVRSLRDRLGARGLSTIHIQQLLWLAAHIAEQRLAPGAGADMRKAFESASGHLAYDSEGCNALLAAQEQIVAEVAHELTYAGLAPQPEYAAMEVGWYLAYLNDSMAANDPSSFVNYARWMQHYFASQGLPDTPLRQSFSALSSSLERYLPQYAANDARSIITAAQRAL